MTTSRLSASGILAADLRPRFGALRSMARDGEGALDEEFVALYEGHFTRVYAFVRSQVSSAEVAQDVVGRVFLKAYDHWRSAPRGEASVFWLFRLARNALIDHWRVEGRRASVNVSLDELAEMAGAGADPEAICAARERARLLLQVIGSLDKTDRIVLGLKFTAQRTNREIAAILEISEAAVSMRLLRALRRLRERLLDLDVV